MNAQLDLLANDGFENGATVPAYGAPTVTRRLSFHTDPGHGWLEVPVTELQQYDLIDKVSHYSYLQGGIAYLEEDCDAGLYLNALKAAGVSFTTEDKHKEVTPIRHYDNFTAERARAALRAMNPAATLDKNRAPATPAPEAAAAATTTPAPELPPFRVVKDIRNGWSAETVIAVPGQRYQLRIQTGKRHNGELSTSCTVVEPTQFGYTWRGFQDYSKHPIRERVRVTDKAVREQHERARQNVAATLADVVAYYTSADYVARFGSEWA